MKTILNTCLQILLLAHSEHIIVGDVTKQRSKTIHNNCSVLKNLNRLFTFCPLRAIHKLARFIITLIFYNFMTAQCDHNHE